MLKILWKRGEIAPEEQFLRLSTIFCYLMLDFYVKRGIRFSLRETVERSTVFIEQFVRTRNCMKQCKIACLYECTGRVITLPPELAAVLASLMALVKMFKL